MEISWLFESIQVPIDIDVKNKSTSVPVSLLLFGKLETTDSGRLKCINNYTHVNVSIIKHVSILTASSSPIPQNLTFVTSSIYRYQVQKLYLTKQSNTCLIPIAKQYNLQVF